MVIFALMLLVILGFTALGVEAGRWYLVRAELAKGVDAAALAAARNISNPNVSPAALAEEFGVENFHAGYLGTPGAGVGTVKFTATMVGSDKVRVTGDVHATAILAKLFGVSTIPVSAVSMAQKKDVEIMMILDRTGSMGNPGTKIERPAEGGQQLPRLFRGHAGPRQGGAHQLRLPRSRWTDALGTNFVD